MKYRVRIVATVEGAICEQARYIAVDQKSPGNAAHWLQRIYDAAETLERWPRRCRLADEDAYRLYEIRQLNVGDYLLFFTVIDETKTVWVIGFRHGRMQARPEDLP